MFSYMISKGVVQIVVAATLLDKVSVAHQSDRTASKHVNLFRTLLLTRTFKGLIDDDTYSAMILMALVCTALTKPLVLLIDKLTSDKGDAYSFADLHLSISGITETLRRASRMVYGTDLPAEWTLPATDVMVSPEEGGGDEKGAHRDTISSDQTANKSPADPAAAFRIAYFWHNLASSTVAPVHAGAAAAAASIEDGTLSSPSAQGYRSSEFRQISQVKRIGLNWFGLGFTAAPALLRTALFAARDAGRRVIITSAVPLQSFQFFDRRRKSDLFPDNNDCVVRVRRARIRRILLSLLHITPVCSSKQRTLDCR